MSRHASTISPQQLVKIYRQAVLQGVPLDKLEARVHERIERLEVSEKAEKTEERQRPQEVQRRLPAVVRVGAMALPLLFVGVGLLLVGNAVLPIVNYYVRTLPEMASTTLKSPIPHEQVLDVTPFVVAQTVGAQTTPVLGTRKDGPIILDTELDFTNLSNWFDGATGQALAQKPSEQPQEYLLEIPKLKIFNAHVGIGGSDLNKNLIAYPGTALPGDQGAPVIFGHSVLRQFYNPNEKNPQRYNSIFSTIMTLQPGDPITIKYNGAEYTYVVRHKTEVKPEDTYILTQQFDVRQLKLVTCVPEGTYLRRGVITAELVTTAEAKSVR